MRNLAAACLFLLASSARAQLASIRVMSAPAPISAPAAISAAAAPMFAASPSLALSAPGLPAASAVLLSAPALAVVAPGELAPATALAAPLPAASAPEKGDAPSSARSAAALSNFSKLVTELMSGDAARSAAAAAELNKLKEAHLNADAKAEKTKVLDPKPMQIPVGMIEVDRKAKQLKGMKDDDADKWLRKRSAPIVEDYKGRKRPVDHHHEIRAAWQAGIDKVYTHNYFDDEMHGLIKALPKEQFYAVTRAMGLYYDRDERGVVQEPGALPSDTRGHTDDPYRSLAGSVRDAGGYEKTSEPFAEFLWAQYFRSRVKIGPKSADFDAAVAEAMKLARDPAAKGLPGYKPK